MIDWVSCSFAYSGPRVWLQALEHNSLTGEFKRTFLKHVSVEGSYSARLQVMVTGGRMSLSGNFVKFLTGQNIVGTDDLARLVEVTYRRVSDLLELPPCLVALAAIRSGDVSLTRTDCTFHFQVGTQEDVHTWLKAVADNTHVRFRGRGHYDAGMASVLFGLRAPKEGVKMRGSSLSSFKFYSKLDELAKHPLRCPERFHDRLKTFVSGCVRAEALYRGPELRALELDHVFNWNADTSRFLNSRWIGKMDIARQVELLAVDEAELPHFLRPTYRLWVKGEDVQALLSRATFYRHRKALMDEFGIDIALGLDCEDARSRRVIPVISVLEAVPVDDASAESLFWDLVNIG